MPYNPTIPPLDAQDLQRWLADELNRINPDILVSQESFGFTIRSVEPKKPTIGQIAFASGDDGGSPPMGWNPGAGEGMYEYTNLGWAKLGGGDGNVVPTSHSVLQDLTSGDDHTQYLNNARGDVRYYTQSAIDSRVINNLSDVTITSVADGEILRYDSVSGDWLNEVMPSTALGTGQIDGGTPISTYLINQNLEGGGANETYKAADNVNGGTA